MVDRQVAAGRQLVDPREEGIGRRGGEEGQIVKQRFFVDRPRLIRILQQRFDFAGKGNAAVMNTVVERLDADTIANEPKPPRPCVPERDGKHAAKFVQASNAPLLKGMQNHLGVGVVGCPLPMAEFLQLTPDFRVIVNFTIEDNAQRAIPITHRLGSSWRQVNDRQPAMRQAYDAVGRKPEPSAIGPAVDHRVPHAGQIFCRCLKVAVFEFQDAGNAAHLLVTRWVD